MVWRRLGAGLPWRSQLYFKYGWPYIMLLLIPAIPNVRGKTARRDDNSERTVLKRRRLWTGANWDDIHCAKRALLERFSDKVGDDREKEYCSNARPQIINNRLLRVIARKEPTLFHVNDKTVLWYLAAKSIWIFQTFLVNPLSCRSCLAVLYDYLSSLVSLRVGRSPRTPQSLPVVVR